MPLRPPSRSRRPPRRLVVPTLGAAMAVLMGGAAMALVPGRPEAAPAGAPSVEPMVPVTATDDERKPASNSPELAVDPTEPRFVVLANRLDAPFSCALQVSGDGGRGWLPARPVPHLPAGVDTCYAPEIAFDSQGLLYYLFVGLHGSGNSPVGAYLSTSSDHARTFSPPREVIRGERYQIRMALDPTPGGAGRLHLVWLEPAAAAPTGGLPSTPNPIMTMHSDDGGRTFSTPLRISDPNRSRAVAPALAVGPDHSVDVLYYDLRDDARDYQGLEGPRWDGTWSLVLTRSTDGGNHFDRGSVVDDEIVPPERVMLIFTMPPPSLAVDASGRLLAAWHDARNGDWDVFFRRSVDGGRSWERPLRLNDDPIHDGRHQYLPRLAVSPSGRVDAIFYDRRSNVENVGADVYYTYSSDGGATFSRNLRLNEVTFSSVVGPRYAVTSARGLVEFGSRIALVSENDRMLAAWTDTSNTRPGIKAQDIMSTEVNLPEDAGIPGWRRAGGIILMVLGVIVGGSVTAAMLRNRPASASSPRKRGTR